MIFAVFRHLRVGIRPLGGARKLVPAWRGLRVKSYAVRKQGQLQLIRPHAVVVGLILPSLFTGHRHGGKGVGEIGVGDIAGSAVHRSGRGQRRGGRVVGDRGFYYTVHNRGGGARAVTGQIRNGVRPWHGGLIPGNVGVRRDICAVRANGEGDGRRAAAVDIALIHPVLAAGEGHRLDVVGEIRSGYVAVAVHRACGGGCGGERIAVRHGFHNGVYRFVIGAFQILWQPRAAVLPQIDGRSLIPSENGLWRKRGARGTHRKRNIGRALAIPIGIIVPGLAAAERNSRQGVGEIGFRYVAVRLADRTAYRGIGIGQVARDGGFFDGVNDLRGLALLVAGQVPKAVRPHAGTGWLHPRYAGLRVYGNPIRQHGERDARWPHTVAVAIVHPSFATRDIYGD